MARIKFDFTPEGGPDSPSHAWAQIVATQKDEDGTAYLTSKCATVEEVEDEVIKLKDALDQCVREAKRLLG